MKITYKKELRYSYMILEGRDGVYEDDFFVKMLSLNNIPGLLPFSCESVNGRLQYFYDITSLSSFEREFENRKITADDLNKFICSFREMIMAADDYFLESNDIVLDSKCIFMDSAADHYYFCCSPHYKGDIAADLTAFSNDLLTRIDYEDKEAVRTAFDLNRLVNAAGFAAGDLDLMLKGNSVTAVPVKTMIKRQAEEYEVSEEKQPDNDPHSQASLSGRTKGYFKGKGFFEIIDDINAGGVLGRIRSWRESADNKAQQTQYDLEEPEQEYIPLAGWINDSAMEKDGTEETEELCGSDADVHWLMPPEGTAGGGCGIYDYPFTVGNIKGSCNMKLESSRVSRTHCRILKGHEGYLIEDLNSKNGTLLNGVLLAAYTPAALLPGDRIRAADTDLVFR